MKEKKMTKTIYRGFDLLLKANGTVDLYEGDTLVGIFQNDDVAMNKVDTIKRDRR